MTVLEEALLDVVLVISQDPGGLHVSWQCPRPAGAFGEHEQEPVRTPERLVSFSFKFLSVFSSAVPRFTNTAFVVAQA
jgi:hypothetical protein